MLLLPSELQSFQNYRTTDNSDYKQENGIRHFTKTARVDDPNNPIAQKDSINTNRQETYFKTWTDGAAELYRKDGMMDRIKTSGIEKG